MVQERVRKIHGKQEIDNIDEVQSAVEKFTKQYNNTMIDDFCGLSSYEM